MKVLVATEKPFAKIAVDGIRKEIEAAGYELALLENIQKRLSCLRLLKMRMLLSFVVILLIRKYWMRLPN